MSSNEYFKLEPPKLATFKYQHDGPEHLSKKRKFSIIICLLASLLIMAVNFVFGILTLVLPVIIYLTRSRLLKLGPRYLLCGDRIIYYANVKEANLSEAEGTLTLITRRGEPFKIEREKFPTSARKPHKIAINKTAKFNKVSARIIEKVGKFSRMTSN